MPHVPIIQTYGIWSPTMESGGACFHFLRISHFIRLGAYLQVRLVAGGREGAASYTGMKPAYWSTVEAASSKAHMSSVSLGSTPTLMVGRSQKAFFLHRVLVGKFEEREFSHVSGLCVREQ
jgi:hypothetical protein